MALKPPKPDPIPDPTLEIGNANSSISPWSSFYDAAEDNPELRFPNSVNVYDQMRNDDQLSALLLAFVLPIFGYRWYIKPNGARDEVVEHIASDFGLPIEGQDDDQPIGRQRDRFSHDDYLRHSMLKLSYGFMMFEQVYRFGEDDEKLHIRKLAPRLPGSITQVQADRDGGLVYIRQFPSGNELDPFDPRGPVQAVSLWGSDFQGPTIPVNRLVAHVNEKEGGNWYGRPWLRSLYRNWLMKDRLIRVDALKHERNGMGVPTGKTTQGVTQGGMRALLAAVTRWKAGETAAVALPPGTDIELKGVQGTLPDTLASIRYHDEQMARRFVAMFTQLGSTDHGSRALGDTFVDFFGLAQQSVAKSYAKVTNAHAIEDLVDLNYSIDENAPLLAFRPDSDNSLPTTELVALIQADAVTVDDELEDWIRSEHDMPDRDDTSPRDALESETQPANRKRERISLAATSTPKDAIDVSLTRPKNAKNERKKNGHESAAKTDFEALNRSYEDALAFLLAQWKTEVKQPQIDSLVEQIEAAASLGDLAGLTAPVMGSDTLKAELQRVALYAVSLAVQEAKDQGITIPPAALDDFVDSIAARSDALSIVMANSIAETAARRAIQEASDDTDFLLLAASVRAHLEGLKDGYLVDNFGAAIHTAQNDARFATLDGGDVEKWYASELNDSPTICTPCSEIDDTEYDTLAAARKDYPTGFFARCEGWSKCRGTLVAIFKEEEDPSVGLDEEDEL